MTRVFNSWSRYGTCSKLSDSSNTGRCEGSCCQQHQDRDQLHQAEAGLTLGLVCVGAGNCRTTSSVMPSAEHTSSQHDTGSGGERVASLTSASVLIGVTRVREHCRRRCLWCERCSAERPSARCSDWMPRRRRWIKSLSRICEGRR